MILNFAEKKIAEIVGKIIKLIEIYYIFCNIEFHRTMGLKF